VLARSGHDAPTPGEVPPQIIARPRTCFSHDTQCGWGCQDTARLEECARHGRAVRERGPGGAQITFLALGLQRQNDPAQTERIAGGCMEAPDLRLGGMPNLLK
jgi:hypothetical protein